MGSASDTSALGSAGGVPVAGDRGGGGQAAARASSRNGPLSASDTPGPRGPRGALGRLPPPLSDTPPGLPRPPATRPGPGRGPPPPAPPARPSRPASARPAPPGPPPPAPHLPARLRPPRTSRPAPPGPHLRARLRPPRTSRPAPPGPPPPAPHLPARLRPPRTSRPASARLRPPRTSRPPLPARSPGQEVHEEEEHHVQQHEEPQVQPVRLLRQPVGPGLRGPGPAPSPAAVRRARLHPAASSGTVTASRHRSGSPTRAERSPAPRPREANPGAPPRAGAQSVASVTTGRRRGHARKRKRPLTYSPGGCGRAELGVPRSGPSGPPRWELGSPGEHAQAGPVALLPRERREGLGWAPAGPRALRSSGVCRREGAPGVAFRKPGGPDGLRPGHRKGPTADAAPWPARAARPCLRAPRPSPVPGGGWADVPAAARASRAGRVTAS
ncbi:uncharacterized protein ACOB7L_021591 [Callospermophilus lateralis]